MRLLHSSIAGISPVLFLVSMIWYLRGFGKIMIVNQHKRIWLLTFTVYVVLTIRHVLNLRFLVDNCGNHHLPYIGVLLDRIALQKNRSASALRSIENCTHSIHEDRLPIYPYTFFS